MKMIKDEELLVGASPRKTTPTSCLIASICVSSLPSAYRLYFSGSLRESIPKGCSFMRNACNVLRGRVSKWRGGGKGGII